MSYIKASGVHGRPGHAVIEIGYALNVEPLLLTIQKVGADPRYLAGNGGWRADPEALQPARVDRQEGRTLIHVGPDIVDRLDDDQRIRVGIVSADFAGEVVWSDIPPSSGGTGRSVFVARPRPAAPAAEVPPPPPPVVEKPKEPEPKPVVLDVPPVIPPRPPERRTLWWVLAVLLLLVAAGAGAYWHFNLWPWPWPKPGPAVLVVPPATDLQRLRQQLMQMMQSDGDPGQVLDGARRLIDSDDAGLRDFGFRAMDFAATRGSASAQLEIGKLYDPRYFRRDSGGITAANPSTAAEWYKRAAESGSREAPSEKQGLCEKLAQPSDGVDEQLRTSTLAQYCN